MKPIKLYFELKDRVENGDIDSYDMLQTCRIIQLMSKTRLTKETREQEKKHREIVVHHFEIILALINSHACEENIEVKRNVPTYDGVTFEGKGVLHNNFIDFDPLLQMIIAEYVQSISLNLPS